MKLREYMEEISERNREPEWMRRLRELALEEWGRREEPRWLRGVEVNVEGMVLYRGEGVRARSWEDLPEDIRRVYDSLGLPEQEKEFLAGLSTGFDSEVVYYNLVAPLAERGVVLLPMEEAVRKYPDLVRRYFGRIYPYTEHKYAALHYALWSGGVFLYVPKGVYVDLPIEAFFYISSALEGQFEHSLIVAEEGAYVHFIEGCAAPTFKDISFHDGAVEVYVGKNAYVRFTTVQNWSKNVINFNNKRAVVEEGGTVEWVEGSIGSKVSVVYPSVILKGKGAKTTINVFSLANGPYVKDGGAKVFHIGEGTVSEVKSKGISARGGVNIYRGLVRINRGARNARASVSCDSLILDRESEAHTYPQAQVEEPTALFTHEATTVRLTQDQLFYLRSRGLTEEEAKSMAVIGFIKDVLRDLPPEYSYILKEVVGADFTKGVG